MQNSDSVVLALVAIIAGFGALVKFMWDTHTKLTQKVLDVVEKNAVSNEKLSNTFDKIMVRVVKK